jgi:class 3 adenylate cyclase
MGDGVLVYFGYPQAHEDDAERAMRAGLALVEAVSRDPGRRVQALGQCGRRAGQRSRNVCSLSVASVIR